MKKSQLLKDYNARVLFQNNNWSIELTQNKEHGQNELCVVHDSINTDWPHFNKDITLVRLNYMFLPKYIIDKLLVLARKHKEEIKETIF